MTDLDETATEAAVVATLAERAAFKPCTVEIGHGDLTAEVLFVPDGKGGYHQHSVKKLLAEYRDAPERRIGTATLTDLVSFIGHVVRFHDEDSAIFADKTPANPSLLCVLDYHRAGAAGAPRFGTHRARYAFPLSDEWVAWRAANGVTMDQEKFARFLEEHLADVGAPDLAGPKAKAFAELFSCGFAGAGKLLELSRGLTVAVGRKVSNHQNLSTGESVLSFAEEHSDAAGKPLKVPGAFLVTLPVFRGGALYQIPARLRYRVQGGSIHWSYDLARLSEVCDHAIDEACDLAAEKTGLPLFAGTPE
jgi:uncharacterized protein YfdQ (DUF2303 family)